MSFLGFGKKKIGLKEATALFERAVEQFGPDIDGKSQEWAKFMLKGMAAILGLPVTYKEEGEKRVADLGSRAVVVEETTKNLVNELLDQMKALKEQVAAEQLKCSSKTAALKHHKQGVEAVLDYFA